MLVQYLVRKLLKAITVDEVLQIVDDGFVYKKRQLSSGEINELRHEVSTFQKSFLWKLISSDIRWDASMRMIEKSVTPEDLVFGKAMIYNLSLIERFMDSLLKTKPR